MGVKPRGDHITVMRLGRFIALRRSPCRLDCQTMSTLLRLLSVVLIALLAGSASAGATGYGPHEREVAMHYAVDEQVESQCARCVGHEPVTCAESCVGSLQPERDTDLVHLDAKDAFVTPWADNLRDGLRSPPRLTPPIA